MPQEEEFLNTMRQVSAAMPPTARLRLVLDELLEMVDSGVVSFVQTRAAGNTCALYRAQQAALNQPQNPQLQLWGAHVNFKENDLPSFVHELTHARCILCYQADTINYAPGGVNNVPLAFNDTAPRGAPPETRDLTSQCQDSRRAAWKRPHCKTFLDLSLTNLRAWADVTDFTAPVPFMKAKQKAEFKRTDKAAHKGDKEAQTRYFQLKTEIQLRGQVQKSRKKKEAGDINAQRLEDEKERKKAFILERINYGLNGMNGLGDTHNEYDTVVNQMLFQMHLWGFRADRVSPLTLTQQDQHVRDGTLPAMYLYDLIAQLAHEAHHRRMVAGGIVDGAAPTIMAPAAVINPPRL